MKYLISLLWYKYHLGSGGGEKMGRIRFRERSWKLFITSCGRFRSRDFWNESSSKEGFCFPVSPSPNRVRRMIGVRTAKYYSLPAVSFGLHRFRQRSREGSFPRNQSGGRRVASLAIDMATKFPIPKDGGVREFRRLVMAPLYNNVTASDRTSHRVWMESLENL